MRRRKGYTLIELVLVMLLLTFVAVSVFLLTGVGSSAYARLSDGRSQASDLRIALSYMDVRIKKIDGIGRVDAVSAPFGGGQALRLTQRLEGADYETYLYVDQGYLKELYIRKGEALTPDMASDLARSDSLQVHFETDRLLAVTLVLQESGAGDKTRQQTLQASQARQATQWIHLRAIAPEDGP